MRRLTPALFSTLVVGLVAVTPAVAVITAITPLDSVLGAYPLICVATVEKVDASRPAMILTMGDVLKGKAAFARVPVDLRGDADAVKGKEVPLLLKRLAPKLPVVLFVEERGKEQTIFAYTNGTWFQMIGMLTDDGPRWAFTHCEPYLRKTFKGTTTELKDVIADVLAGKRKAPKPDLKEKPGLGPEVEEKKPEDKSDKGVAPGTSIRPLARGPLLGVVPSVFVMGPLAFLAMLFPAVFGGLILVLRKWAIGLSVLSLNSTLWCVYEWWLAPAYATQWWATPLAVWGVMTALTLGGLLLAWRRHLVTPTFHRPGKWELGVLGVGSLLCLGWVVLDRKAALSNPLLLQKMLWTISGGVWVATLHACYLRWVAGRQIAPRPGLPGEGVLLWGTLAVLIGLGSTFLIETAAAPPAAPEGQTYRVVWNFRLPGERGWIASSPVVDGDRVYIGAVHPRGFSSSGALYCLDYASGNMIWSFNDEGRMKDVFSSPCLSEGRLYIGEGFHQHLGCKLYCLDARSGKKLWEHATGSHTESSPCVVNGKVYFGAGDDGMFCLDAVDGSEKWHLDGLHVDANPLVIGGKVYCGSGVGDAYKETTVFCLDAATGKQVWRMPVDLPVWGQPTLDGRYLYVGLGNGNFMESAANPGGALLCLEAETGKRTWRTDARDGVLGRPVVASGRAWFVSRDENCYCTDLKGEVKWKTNLKGPLVASPALVQWPRGPVALYVASGQGQLVRLDPATGEVRWAFDLQGAATMEEAVIFSTPAVQEEGGGKRRILVGCGLENFNHGILYCIEDSQ